MQVTMNVIGPELEYFGEYLNKTLVSPAPLLNRIMAYLARNRGKQMRPVFVLLSARLGGPANESSYRAAVLVEMLHTASLVHDDLVDDSMRRRGAFSVNAIWKNRAAVLTGDNLFTKSLLLSLCHDDHRILKICSEAIRQMVESELLQIVKSHKLNFDEQVYFDTINAKTASFLAAACAAGASSTFTDDTLVKKMHSFGEKAGMAFQLKDDLFDYGNADIGKPTGNDIKEKKMTLPLIFTLNNCDKTLRKKLVHIIKYQNTVKEKVNYVIEEVVKAGGTRYAEAKMLAYRDEALQLLYGFPASEVRSALEEQVRYITDRKY